MTKLYIIGIGYRPLDKRAGEIILNSDVILASNRLFEVFRGYEEFEEVKDKIKVINSVDTIINFIKSQILNLKSQSIILLTSGDPMFFGIGRRAVKEFGKEIIEISPDLSSIQIAFSKIKELWDDAFLMSLHGGSDPEKKRRLEYKVSDIPSLLTRHNKIAILTDKVNNPSTIAKIIARSKVTKQSKGLEILRGACPKQNNEIPRFARNDKRGAQNDRSEGAITIYVCERLGYPDEKIIEGTPEEIAGMSFPEPNVVIIRSAVSGQQSAVSFGLKEDEIAHSRGLITKDEIRAVTIHKLRLPQKGVFWDIGAGSGSVSIETARLYPELKIFAIEKDKEQINHIKENKNKFNTVNIEIIKGEAPYALADIPSPDRVFIGGSGGRLKEIIDFIGKMQTAIIVANATTIETLNEAIQNLENNGFATEVSEVSISRTKTIADKRRLNALNPVFVITGEKLK